MSTDWSFENLIEEVKDTGRFDDYQRATNRTAIYPGAGTGNTTALTYLGLGLGEAGEVQGKLKKVLRDHDGVLTHVQRTAILSELGDVLWYVARLADELGESLMDVATNNLDKLNARKTAGTIGGSGDNR